MPAYNVRDSREVEMPQRNHDVRKWLFGLVTIIAALLVLGTVLEFVRSASFAHPVSFALDIIVKVGIWLSYFTITRDVRAVRQLADTLAVKIETSSAVCCMLAYTLAVSTIKW